MASMQLLDRAVIRTTAKFAGSFLLMAGLAATAHAQATWVGDTSQDWNTAANWSSDPANPSGNFTINKATDGVFPIVSASSVFTPVDIFIANGTGAVGRLDQTGGALATGTPNWFIVSTERGTGTYNMSGGTLSAQEVHVARSGLSANGTINLSGTASISTRGGFVIGDGTNNTAAAVGTVNVGSGASIQSEGDLLVAFAGASTTVGTLNIESGATVSVGSTIERWAILSYWDSSNGFININGGTLNLNANTDLRFSVGSWGPGASNGTSAVTINSGALNGGATSVIDLNNNADRATVSNTLNLNGGTVTIGQIRSGKATGTRVVNFNGGTLKAAAADVSPTNFFIAANAASTAAVKAGGAIIDSNGFDITIAKALTADSVSTGGGLTKLGTGKLTLTGVNTYAGNTTVSDGTLALADNAAIQFAVGANGVNSKLTGPGTVTLDGDIAFDLTNASTAVGNSWTVIDHATLTETYGPTFSVAGFSLNGTKWTKPAVGTTIYQFDPATGLLTTVVDPTITFPPPVVTAGPSEATYPLGSDITLRVSATGTGNLTYQWYYQADSGATPTAISGANSSSYTVTSATAAANGIYSVIVSDDANGSTPTTTTFPAYTVQPGASFAVAHYRFEEGPALATISSTLDSIGTNHLTVLGTPNYANDALPYSIIPATGAANTLGVNFPATGNNGLIAPTSGTLAEEPFTSFTIEAFFRLDNLNGWQTVVGRDDSANPGQGPGAQGLFYLSKAGAAVGTGLNNAFRIELIDRSGTSLQVNSQSVPVVGNWYHVAAVGDSTKGTLTLFVNGVSVGSVTGFTGLLVPTTGSDTPWTLGRGDYGFNNVDFLRGDLDEVRFSRAALPPSQFLNSANGISVVNPSVTVSPGSQTVGTGASLTLTANGISNMGGSVTYQWYKDDVILSGQTNASLAIDTASTAGSGSYKVVVSDNTPGYVVSADSIVSISVIELPGAGRRSIGLNFVGAGNGSWSEEVAVLASDYVAGFYPAANWNNSAAVTGVASQSTPLALAESNGSTGYTTATWAAANTWSARLGLGLVADKDANGKLLHGYMETRSATGATVTFANIPYGTYDVYVYVAGGVGANVGAVTLDRANSPTYYYRIFQNDSYATTPYAPLAMIGASLDATAAATAAPATFVRFTGVTGSELVITAKDAVLNANAGGIAAVQIVDTTPAGTAYPPTVTTAPSSLLRVGGASASLSVSAVSNNSGGVLSYQWQKNEVDLPGETSANLNLSSLTSADTGRYTVVITDTTSGGSATTSRTASVVVVDANRALLINGDLGTSAVSVMPYSGVLLSDGTVSASNVGAQTNTWNNVTTAAGSGSGVLSSESSGLGLAGLTLAYAGVGGSADSLNEADGAIDITGNSASGAPILRDLAFTDSQTVPMTLTVGGLQALSGHRVKLVVYASGFSSTFSSITNLNDAATITLASANNHLAQAPAATDNGQGRDLRYNLQAFVAFDGIVAADGTVAWSVGADSDGGRIPMNAFQLLVTSEEVSPPVPTGLAATAGNGQVGLTWTASAGATTYTIARSTTAGGPYTTLSAGIVATESYTDVTAVNGTTYYYVVASANALATSAYSAEASATPVNTGTALELWRQSKFGSSANSGNGADASDADSDGIPNLLEYALGTEPLTPNSGAAATVGRSGNFLTLGFHHIGDATLVYSIEATNDVTGSWTTVQTYQAFSAAGDEVYEDTVSLATQPRRFLRLRVTTQ